MFNTRVKFLKIAMERKEEGEGEGREREGGRERERELATATSQSLQRFAKSCSTDCSYHCSAFIIRISDFVFTKLNKFFIQ
jgi:hypothetical protein